MTTRAILSLLAMVMILATGCATVLGYNFDVAVKNASVEPVTNVTVTSAKGFWDQPGYLSPGARKSIAGPFRQHYADLWTVRWTTDKGQQFERILNLTQSFSRPFQGQLLFTIDADNNVSHSSVDFSYR